jgi:phosphomannomutase/phosphoglucomutase
MARTVTLNPLMFRAYDIRGEVEKDLTPEVLEILGRAYGTYIQKISGKGIAVGRDNRVSSQVFQASFIAGARATGCDVTEVGMVTSPMLYFATAYWKFDGGVNISGSHNPVQYNGVKLTARGAAPIAEEKIQEIRRIAESGAFAQGKGGLVERLVADEYIRYVTEHARLERPLKVAIDAGNGVAGPYAPPILRKLGCDLTELYTESDGTFPHHLPDPEVPGTLDDLVREVLARHADIGIAYDGDGDRVGVIDEKGERHEADELLMLLARDFLQRHPGERVMMDVKSSQLLVDDIKAHSGVPVMSRTGHSLIKEKMRAEGILLAGEVSGHMFFSEDWFGFDDAILASVRLLEVLSRDARPLSAHWEGLPKVYSTPELKAPCPDADKFRIVGELTAFFKQHYPVLDIDGARVTFPEGWALVRPSNTNPYLTLRFEAKTQQALDEMKALMYEKLRAYPQVTLPKGEG